MRITALLLFISFAAFSQSVLKSDNRKGLFTDARGSGAANKLIDGGGNRFVPASEIPVPKFNPDGTVADDFYYSKGMGFGTP